MKTEIIEEVVRKILAEMEDSKDNKFDYYDYGIFDDMDDAIEASNKAQRELFNMSIEQRGKLVDSMRAAILEPDNLETLSRKAVEETGIGKYEDKILKNKAAAENSPGIEDLTTWAKTGENGITIEEYCPFGVIGSITPTTNPTETIICNSIGMIAGGNSVVFSPHPRAKETSIMLITLLNKALEKVGAPRNLISMVREPSIENTNKMMKNNKIRLLVATGGPGIVNTVLSSGKKAIGAGAGNPPVVVDETADIEKAAKDIVDGSSFDNNVPCIAEKEVFVVREVFDKLILHMQKNGAYLLNDKEIIEKMDKMVSKDDGKPKVDYVGKDAKVILRDLGIDVPSNIKLIIFKANKEHHLVQEEMMMPILPIVCCDNVDKAIDYAYQAEHGNRHTAIMHSKNVDKLTKMAKLLECTIFVKNAPSYAGIGVGGEGFTTFTIAGPTGEGLTSARSFCRKRRCTMIDSFNIR
ncbi:aldehyde dehydrogenase EutE [Anaerococcus sp. AGMB09787]|uniref:aldehyde dehydrogenase family protein n=1 Tax=Anaerococcus sp. AGMB09787 TaxID=2922869 RepID=UPI00243458B1|nr:aldehyde dehydrogenase EutE [Anaerococcus sp. AGMB09787]